MEYKDYYKTLGLGREATQEEIKRAYRKLARKYHPDVNKAADAEDKFKDVGEAYEVLKDPEKRTAYDRLGRGARPGEEFQPPPGWEAGFQFGGSGFSGASGSGFSDFFENLFGGGFQGGAAQGFSRDGEDHHATITIDLEDTIAGANRQITLQHPVAGRDGGARRQTRTLNVRIPRGVRPGQNIRLTGQGGPASGPGRPGDLYLKVTVRPHPLYRVNGSDLHLDLPLAPWEAALGASVQVPTPNGKVDLKIPPDTHSGRKLRLRGRGLPGQPPGDMYVHVSIALPPARTDEVQALYRRMAEISRFNPRAHLEA